MLILHILALISTCISACSQEPQTSSLLEEFPAWKGGRPSSVIQDWSRDGKSYSVHAFNYGDTTVVYRNYNGMLYSERYVDDELVEVVEY